MFEAKGIMKSSKYMLGCAAYLSQVKITDFHFSGAISKDTLVKIVFRSLRAEFKRSIARLSNLFDEKITMSSA